VTPGRSVCERHPHYTPSNMYTKGGREGGREGGGARERVGGREGEERRGRARERCRGERGSDEDSEEHAYAREREEGRWNATR